MTAMWRVRHCKHANESWGFVDMIDRTEALVEQGSQSLVEFAFDVDNNKLPIICKTIPYDAVDVDKVVEAQNLASAFGIAPRIYEVHENGSKIRIVMEYVNAKTLRDLVEEKGVGIITKELKTQMYIKISLLYHLKIAHRDLHSDNILLEDMNGTYKVIVIDYDDVCFPVVIPDNEKMKVVEVGKYTLILNNKTFESEREKLMQVYKKKGRSANKIVNSVYDRMTKPEFYI